MSPIDEGLMIKIRCIVCFMLLTDLPQLCLKQLG